MTGKISLVALAVGNAVLLLQYDSHCISLGYFCY